MTQHNVHHIETLATFPLPNGRTVRIERHETNGIPQYIEAAIQCEDNMSTDDSVLIWQREDSEA